jgi:hypothetical protein
MICTTARQNKAQVTQRLPQLVPFITAQRARDIYDLCCDIKHAAAPMLKTSLANAQVTANDQTRIDAVSSLYEAVRSLLRRSLMDRSFAETLSDSNKLKTTYQVYDSKGHLV